jgi:hypothetical protein
MVKIEEIFLIIDAVNHGKPVRRATPKGRMFMEFGSGIACYTKCYTKHNMRGIREQIPRLHDRKSQQCGHMDAPVRNFDLVRHCGLV